MDNFAIQVIDGIETIYEEDLERLKRLESFENEESDAEYDSAIAYEINDENTVTYFTKELTSHAVNHILTSVEYPATSPEGVAYVFNIEGWEEPLVVFKDIQYSIGKPGGEYKVICPYLNVVIEERKEKLRELRIANTIKEREHDLSKNNSYEIIYLHINIVFALN
ncbi:hypothetical protein C2G38_2148126 [Gigaspora rosea]|uniref:Uncharacterized protein n=1 Tax=Gigaspora rosea TaxID=44941 RepID=A0A397UBY4_9GLOM|nr:hypothetical protein C2G38_2148126 [Gigaspora rosea]